MGSFNGHCALTNMPILNGDAYWVVFKDADYWKPGQPECGLIFIPEFLNKHFEGVYFGEYDSYGRVAPKSPGATVPSDLWDSPYRNYNYRHFKVSALAWQETVAFVENKLLKKAIWCPYQNAWKHYHTAIQYAIECADLGIHQLHPRGSGDDLFRELLCVLIFMDKTQRNPFVADGITCHQDVDVNAEKLIQKLASQNLKAVREFYRSCD